MQSTTTIQSSDPKTNILLDIEKFCRKNYFEMNKKQNRGIINLDYSDGIKDILREIIENHFGGIFPEVKKNK
jgi:hypothetical protein